MTPRPKWLPEIVSVNGEWKAVLKRLYAIFDVDFKQTRREFEGRHVWWDRTVLPGERYEEGFWHLITRADKAAGERFLDPRRAERLPWCGPTVSHSSDVSIKVWDYKEGSGRVRTYVWLENWDYVIILEKRRQRVGEIAFLITAYHVDGESQRRNLNSKFSNRRV
jgi:hypothetical protein